MHYDHVVAGGCSFTYGAELLDRNDRFTKRIADHYNAALLDYSRNGYGNESISNRLVDGLLYQVKNNLIDPKKTLVIVCWTYGTRLAFYNKDVKGWFSLFPHRVDKNIMKNRLNMDVRSDITFKKILESMIIESMHPSKNKSLVFLMQEIRNLVYKYYVQSDKYRTEVPAILQNKIDDLRVELDKLSDRSNDELVSLKNKVEDYLEHAVYDAVFASDKFYSKHVHYSDVKYYFDNYTDPLYLIYHLTSLFHKTKTFLECHGFNNYVFAFACQDTKQIFQTSVEDYDLLFSDCFTKEGFGEFKNMLTDIDTSRIFNESFVQFSLDNNYKIGEAGHPLEEAHTKYADKMLAFVAERFGNEKY